MIYILTAKRIFIFITLIMSGISHAVLAVADSSKAEPASKMTEQLLITPPGAEKFDQALINKIKKTKSQKAKNYTPRTKHLTDTGKAKYTNRLFLESSPYLLQHAHNPVNWYPWGDAAFAAAARLNRPVLLSVGYSTCHWCHVMEEESFEDIEIATYINKNFIAIKVDREERPDIDAIYMAALNALGMNGGWPMNVWLTPKREPFYGGTYFPARDGDRGASIGLLTLLQQLKQTYQFQPESIAQASQSIVSAIKENLRSESVSGVPEIKILHRAVNYYKSNFDEFYGGMKQAPKFPSTTPVQFLLRYYKQTADKKVLHMAELTLDKMAAGGMYDQVGGGFHRYSTDNEWLVPHFEKMLYDNALLVVDYIEAYQLTGNKRYKQVAEDILYYVTREMTSVNGGFYSATDADSLTPDGKREEGYYFTWRKDEITKVLSEKNAETIFKYYAVTGGGNFEGRNILNMPLTLKEFSQENKISEDKLVKIISDSKEMLYKERNKRAAPLRDEKILVAWNGLMISAYAKAGQVLNNSAFIQQAVKAAQFVLDKNYINGRLLRSYKDGAAKHNAYLDDYAFFIAGLIDIYEATYDIRWLTKAIELDKVLESQYEDKKYGGYFMTSNDHEKLIAREKPAYDGALPGGNSIQLMNLLRLAEFTSNEAYKKRAKKMLQAFSNTLNNYPTSLSKMLSAVSFYYDEVKEIVIVTPEHKKQQADKFIRELVKHYIPGKILAVTSEGEDIKRQEKIIPLVQGKKAIKGQTTAYVCKFGACELPTSNVDTFIQRISR